MFYLPCHHRHACSNMRTQLLLKAVRGVVHVLQHEPVHPGLQVDLRLLRHPVQDLRHAHGGGGSAWQRADEKIMKFSEICLAEAKEKNVRKLKTIPGRRKNAKVLIRNLAELEHGALQARCSGLQAVDEPEKTFFTLYKSRNFMFKDLFFS